MSLPPCRRPRRAGPGVAAGVLLAAGCSREATLTFPGKVDSGEPPAVDADGDGYAPGPDGDCDDADPDRSPGQPDVCNGVDDDCDGVIDGGTVEVDGAAREGACSGPGAFAAWNGDEPYVLAAPGSWPDARTACLTIGYDLVVIDGGDEGAWLADTASALLPAWGLPEGEDRVWIGLSWDAAAGDWAWVDGSARAASEPWADGHPDTPGGTPAEGWTGVALSVGSQTWQVAPDAAALAWACARRR